MYFAFGRVIVLGIHRFKHSNKKAHNELGTHKAVEIGNFNQKETKEGVFHHGMENI